MGHSLQNGSGVYIQKSHSLQNSVCNNYLEEFVNFKIAVVCMFRSVLNFGIRVVHIFRRAMNIGIAVVYIFRRVMNRAVSFF